MAGVVAAAGPAAAQSGDFEAALDWIYYHDGVGRTISYDFAGATMDAAGSVAIPSGAVTVPGSESGVTFSWIPGDAAQEVSLSGGAYYISVPQALSSPRSIPTASITVDGSAADWAGVSAYIQDGTGDILDPGAPAGADVVTVKLAYSPDYSKLYILYQLAANASTDVWYRLFLDNNANDETDEPGDYQIDASYWGSSWDVITQSWDDDENWYPVAEGGVIAVSGSVVELSVNCSAVGLPAKTNVRGRTMQTEAPYETYDVLDSHFLETEGFAFLAADGTAAGTATEWTAAARFSNFANPGFGDGSPYFRYYGAMVANGSLSGGYLEACISADWATGDFEGSEFEDTLVIQAFVESDGEDDYEWDWSPGTGGGVVLEGLDPDTAVVDLKVDITNSGQTASFYYRINSAAGDHTGGDWQLATTHTLPGGVGTIYGFPAAVPGVGLETGFMRSAPMYRFWSPLHSRHFYTMSKAERDSVRATYPESTWTYEGIAYHALADDDTSGLAAIYRFWSPLHSAHFYTISEAERDSVIATYPGSVWSYEGAAFYGYPDGEQPDDAKAVHRFWSPLYSGHFYTISEAEKDAVIATYPSSVWSYEGVAWYAFE
jgi:hypothetical protein